MNAETRIEGSIKFTFSDQVLWLLPQKAIYWQEKKMLIIADLHLGKAAHFRKAGIPVPTIIHQDDLSTLDFLIQYFMPEKVLILGDLFHSIYNKEWEDFAGFLDKRSDIEFNLVKGNHDILPVEIYKISNLSMAEDQLIMAPFCFSHKPLFAVPSLKQESEPEEIHLAKKYYNLCGHIHPGISIRDKLGQAVRMPCFYFGQRGGVLPAFGKFTGMKCLKAPPSDHVFGIAELSRSYSRVFKV